MRKMENEIWKTLINYEESLEISTIKKNEIDNTKHTMKIVITIILKRERQRETERDRQREIDRERERETERDRQRERDIK